MTTFDIIWQQKDLKLFDNPLILLIPVIFCFSLFSKVQLIIFSRKSVLYISGIFCSKSITQNSGQEHWRGYREKREDSCISKHYKQQHGREGELCPDYTGGGGSEDHELGGAVLNYKLEFNICSDWHRERRWPWPTSSFTNNTTTWATNPPRLTGRGGAGGERGRGCSGIGEEQILGEEEIRNDIILQKWVSKSSSRKRVECILEEEGSKSKKP